MRHAVRKAVRRIRSTTPHQTSEILRQEVARLQRELQIAHDRIQSLEQTVQQRRGLDENLITVFISSLPLTAREQKVATEFLHFPTDESLADKLTVSEQTIRNQLNSIKKKLGFETRVELLLYLLTCGERPRKNPA